MAIFDYITSDEFRKSLEADYQEMTLCFNAGAWKAVHVLAGSIIEAVLLDYIVAESFVSQDEALKMDLGTAINLCKDKKVISARTSDLSSVVKSYRNLIHPGRIIRLNEHIDKNSAEVAKALVGIVVDEIERQKRETYGFTAEQIIAKIRRDSSADTIISHIIKQTNPAEIEKLLLKVLPNAYVDYLQEFDRIEHLPMSFSICFRTAFEQASNELKKKISQNFVRIIKEESDRFLFAYGKLFFRASDMQYLSQDDIEITKNYLFGRLENDLEGWLSTIAGIGSFISDDEVNKLVDILVRAVNSNDMDLSITAEKRLIDEGSAISGSVGNKFLKRLNDWSVSYRNKKLEKYAIAVDNIKASIEIPF
jgi:hypothetical protein